MQYWEKISKKTKHRQKCPLYKLYLPTLIYINYDKQFKIIWAIVSSLPASLNAAESKGKKNLFISNTDICKHFSCCQCCIFFNCSIHMTWSRLETHYFPQTQCRRPTQKRRESCLWIYVRLLTELRPDHTASPAALAGGGWIFHNPSWHSYANKPTEPNAGLKLF